MPEGGLPFLTLFKLRGKSLELVRDGILFVSASDIGIVSETHRKKFRKTAIVYCRRWESTVDTADIVRFFIVAVVSGIYVFLPVEQILCRKWKCG